MNGVKYGKFLWTHIGKSLNQKHVRFFAAERKLLDVKVDSKTGISTVTMQNPPVNALRLDLIKELTGILIQIERDNGKGMLLTSSLPNIFSAGLDLMEVYKPNQDRLKLYWTTLQDMWLNLYSTSFPTAVAITGHSPAGGCMLSVSCDYRVMVQGDYTIGFNESQLGLAVPTWFADAFRNVVPQRQAEMAMITGKMFKVDEALKVGLIDEVATDSNDAINKALAFITKLSKFNLRAISQTKLAFRYDAIKCLQETREQDLRGILKFVSSPDVQKGLEMYIQSLKKK